MLISERGYHSADDLPGSTFIEWSTDDFPPEALILWKKNGMFLQATTFVDKSRVKG
jgi:hypothetical protein